MVFYPMKGRIRKYDIKFVNEIDGVDVLPVKCQVMPLLGQRRHQQEGLQSGW